MHTFVLVLGVVFQIAALGWAVFFYLKVLRPMMVIYGATWRDALMGLGLFLNIGALVAVPVLFGVRLHPIILVGLGICALHAWMRFWVRRPHRSVER